MKKAMSNVDVAAVVDELKSRLIGGFVGKAYQQSSDKIWLIVQSPKEGRLNLLLQAGKRVYITRQPRPASKTPPQFPTMLRIHLSGGRITDIKQHDFDRVLEITVERGGSPNYLVIELFPKGSMILLDQSRRILTVLLKLLYRGRRMAAGEEYLYRMNQPDPRTISMEALSGLLTSSDQDLVRTLVRGLNMGGTYGEEVCLRANINKNKPAMQLDEDEISHIYQALRDVFLSQTLDPHIVMNNGIPVDVLPRPLKVYQGSEINRFAVFSDALDEFFIGMDIEEPKQSPIDRRIEIQRKAIQEFEARENELIAKGELIYKRYWDIEKILKVIRAAREKGYTYLQIWERIEGSKLPEARLIRSIDSMGEVRLTLDTVELDLNSGLTVPQNAQRYYDQSKEMARKAKGARIALDATEHLKGSRDVSKRSKIQTFRRRKPKWFERFRWFFSSDGFLVIGGRDADSNEEVYSKYLDKRDLALHTDEPGAPLTVIKTEGEDVPDTTLLEAAQFAVSYSSIWKAGQFSGDCYVVKGNQVTKTPEHGEFLRKGAFVIRGERRYFHNLAVGISIGISNGVLIGGPSSAIMSLADPIVEIEPGQYNPDDLAKRIYRLFSERIEDKAYLKSIASIDQIVHFLPSGGSRIKDDQQE